MSRSVFASKAVTLYLHFTPVLPNVLSNISKGHL